MHEAALRHGSESRAVCDHKSAAGPVVKAVRGTLIRSSVETLKVLGYYDRYLSRLAPELREQIPYTVAMSWMPLELAFKHYEACDALELDDAQLSEMGQVVARRYVHSVLGTLLRTVRSAGLDAPWVGLASQPRVWDRMYLGGGLSVYRVGPKDAHLELRGLPLVQLRYFRTAYCGYMEGLAGLVVRRAYIRIVKAREPHPYTLAVAGSWV